MTQDLTVGKPLLRVWQFAVPVLFGLLLQQVYSLVDTAIVGHALGVMALGGVGATGSVNFLVLGFCGGLCTGMAIPLAQSFGAGEYHQLRRYVAGCVWLGLIMSALLLAVTLPATRGLLRLMGTPAEQMDYAFDYIFIIFVGIPTTILYNMGACVLRALGDSKSPVWFLAAASAINIVLDLLTVCVLGMGVAGAAIATVVSQLGSGLLCVAYLKKRFPILHMEKDDWKTSRPEAMRLLGMGVPVRTAVFPSRPSAPSSCKALSIPLVQCVCRALQWRGKFIRCWPVRSTHWPWRPQTSQGRISARASMTASSRERMPVCSSEFCTAFCSC